MTDAREPAALQAQNEALRRTVDSLMKRVEGFLGGSGSAHDAFAQSVLLQEAVKRRTIELEHITQSVRAEGERRRLAEEQMHRERRLLMSVLSHIPHLVSWKDLSCVYQGCNSSFARFAGLEGPEQIVGLSDDQLPRKCPDAQRRVECENEVMRTGEPRLHAEVSCATHRGESVTLLSSTVPMRSDTGEISGVLVISADISSRKALEAQLAQAQKLESIGQLAAGIAHEINTPAQYVSDNTRFLNDQFAEILRVLDLYSACMQPGGEAKSWQQRADEINSTLKDVDYDFLRTEIPLAIEQSLEGLGRITEIVKAMKEFSHPGSGQREPANLNDAITSTATVCRSRWKYAADLELRLDPGLPAVPCLLAEFNQVILNLMVNAADAIAERHGPNAKGRIVITSGADADMAEIRVSDNGAGIPDSIRNRIFDPFFTTKGVGKGTGQGLAISRDVVVGKHGGELRCESQPGEGTTFTVRLPLRIAAPRHAAA